MALTEQNEPRFMLKALIGYLYFVQGMILALCGTIPLTYKELPSYQILGYFSAATLPFSFKFITAPLIEKYSLITYGRRKFWIVCSMTLASIVIFAISNIVDHNDKQIETAALLFMITLCVSVQDISTDALGIKQLRKPELSSFLQSVFLQIGYVLGSLSIGQVTSQSFGQYFGFQGAIISVGDFLLFMIPIVIGPTLWIHFSFNQSVTQKEQTVQRLSLWQVITHYKHFILPKYRVCRQAILFLMMFQGMTFFNAGYTIQLIKSSVLSKEFTISLSNFSCVIILPLTYLLSRYVKKDNLQATERMIYISRGIVIAIIFFSGSDSEMFATVSLFTLQLLSSCHFYLHGIIMNSFQDSKFEGMSVTMMASLSNLGRNSTLHLQVIGKYGFYNSVLYSFVYTAIMAGTMKRFHGWINKGHQQEEDYQKEIHQHQD